MSVAGPGKALDRGAIADLWRRTLAQIPSLFGRLVYFASLRDQNTGLYQHHGFSSLFGHEEAHRALAESHARTFSEWLNFSLERQKEDLDLYLAGLPEDRSTVVSSWLRLKPYQSYAPVAARPGEMQLYITDVEALLEVLRLEAGVASPDPDA
jgi:hypothetical protein